MYKRVVLTILIIFFAPVCFAVDRNDLNVEFFNRFNDDYLYQYVNEAIDNNHNAKQATIRVEEYRQNVKSQFANELPSLSVAANYLGMHVPEINPVVDNIRKNNFVLPFIVNYEADFLLKNRDKTKSAKKSLKIMKYTEFGTIRKCHKKRKYNYSRTRRYASFGTMRLRSTISQ